MVQKGNYPNEIPKCCASLNPAELLARLIRFETINPPGNEAECISFIKGILDSAGIESTLLAKDERRPNLVARIPGKDSTAPILMQGHIDVVPTGGQPWTHPPFEGKVVDGFVWGRGALDMKGGIVMMICALLKARRENIPLKRDVILAIVSDEEAGGESGAKFLVENHAGIFNGVKYAIGEFGGFSLQVGRKRFYPIMVAEKQVCWMKLKIRGTGGHASLTHRGTPMAKLGYILQKLDSARLPAHVSKSARLMITSMSREVGFPANILLKLLLVPSLTDTILNLLGQRGEMFEAVLHNTLNATIVRGGEKINVIPSEITLELDGRVVPGCSSQEMLHEIKDVIGMDVEIQRFEPYEDKVDMGMFEELSTALRKCDPDAMPIPFLLPAVTDGRHFARLGIQTYGFTPMRLPSEMNFSKLIHAADERIPVDALEFGTQAVLNLIT